MINWLSRILGTPGALQDRSFGFEGVNAVAELLRDGLYDSVRAYYYGLRHDQRTALVEGLALTRRHEIPIRRWCKEEPQDGLANLLRGVLWMHTAWQARDGVAASTMGSSRRKAFFSQLDRAHKCLDNATYRHKGDPEPFARMVRVLTALQEPIKYVQHYHQQAMRLEPDHLYAQIFMLDALTEKWHGSHDQMLAFARETVSQIAEGSLVHLLIPMAHIEVWLNIKDVGYHEKHFQSSSVQQEVIDAYQDSVLSPYFDTRSQLHPVIYNYFCFAFHLMGNRKQAMVESRNFGQHISYYPWAYERVFSVAGIQKLLKA